MSNTKLKTPYKMFVAKFKNTEPDKIEDFLKRSIVTDYVNYETKLAEITKICELCNYTEILDLENPDQKKRVFKRNTPFMYYWIKLRMIANYTNIEITEGEELAAYNALDEIGAIDAITTLLPEAEVTKWMTMLQMINDDIYMNERDIAGYLDTKMDAVGIVLNTMLSGLSEVVGKLEDKENVN